MEYIDILNDKGESTGKTATRSEIHKCGYWHRAIHILLINSKNEILIQKRSSNKEKNPNLWDISCAGHISSGETSIQGAIRECEEELGIKVDKQDMKLIYTIRKSYMPKQGFMENELQDVYLCKIDARINEITIQKEEVSEVKYIPFKLYVEKIVNKNEEFVKRGDSYKEVIEIMNKCLYKK